MLDRSFLLLSVLYIVVCTCWRRTWHPLQGSCLENPVDRGAWRAAVHGVAQSRTRLKWLSMHACLGEGNANPLQNSCLENPRDGGAWWAAVCGVVQSRTRLKRLSSSSRSNLAAAAAAMCTCQPQSLSSSTPLILLSKVGRNFKYLFFVLVKENFWSLSTSFLYVVSYIIYLNSDMLGLILLISYWLWIIFFCIILNSLLEF